MGGGEAGSPGVFLFLSSCSYTGPTLPALLPRWREWALPCGQRCGQRGRRAGARVAWSLAPSARAEGGIRMGGTTRGQHSDGLNP